MPLGILCNYLTMKKTYVGLLSEFLYVEAEGAFLAASGVAENVIEPVNVTVNDFTEGETKAVDFGDISFN